MRSEAAVERLRSLGQRPTPQRVAILDALSQAGGHLSAETVLDAVRQRAPGISLSTVYRTLELFRDLGLVTETDLGSGSRVYELSGTERHHHAVCHHCRVSVEIDDRVIAPLREAVRTHYRFEPDIEHLAIFGLCETCRTSGSAAGELMEDA